MFYGAINNQSLYDKLIPDVRIETTFGHREMDLITIVRFRLYKGKEPIGGFEIHEVPWCCGMIFVSGIQRYSKNNNNIVRLATTIIKYAMQRGGYSAAQCIIPGDTMKKHNLWLHELFEKQEWHLLRGSRVKNTRSDNYLYTYQLEAN